QNQPQCKEKQPREIHEAVCSFCEGKTHTRHRLATPARHLSASVRKENDLLMVVLDRFNNTTFLRLRQVPVKSKNARQDNAPTARFHQYNFRRKFTFSLLFSLFSIHSRR
ncbi:MAG: hypothetical protein IJ497_02365, partial [Clostridia bacterium]|nr:hypothetical protein [Clostridia bacterium]